MNIVNEMIIHDETIFDQQVVETILLVLQKNISTLFLSLRRQDLSMLSIEELVGSFRAHEKVRFFREDKPKRQCSSLEKNEISQKFSKDQQKKNYNPKKK